jgi:hypothetical protein
MITQLEILEKAEARKKVTLRSQLLVVFPAAFLIVFLRQPAALLHARFFAEGGKVWFADAYNYGWWRVLFKPYQGYLPLLQRLTGAAALSVTLLHAPFVENIVAIAVQTLPVCIIISPRSSGWGTLRFRAILSIMYLVLPNTQEVLVGSITNSQWVLALCALLLLVGSRPESRAAYIANVSFLLLCCLTGPFCIALFPISLALLWFSMDDPWCKTCATIFGAGAIAQGVTLVTHISSRSHPAIGPSLKGILDILDSQVFLGTLLGPNTLFTALSVSSLVFIATVGSIPILACCFYLRIIEMRCLVALSALIFIGSLANPLTLAIPGVTGWWILARDPGSRYWFFPCLTFAWSLAFCLRSVKPILRLPAVCLICLMFIGVARDYRCQVPVDTDFESHARQFDEASPGSEIVIPQNPPGWSFILRKR